MAAPATQTVANSEISGFWRSIGLMAQVSALCRGSASSQPPYQEVLRLIRQLVPFDSATLFVYNHKLGKMDARTSLDGRLEIPGVVRISPGKGQPVWKAPEMKPILLPLMLRQGLPDTVRQYESLLALPLVSGGDLIGALNIGCRRPGAFDDNDIRLMTVVTDLFAAATERQVCKEREALLNQALAQACRDNSGIELHNIASDRLNVAAELVASVHHQINNPLAVIVGNVQCLLIEKQTLDEKTLGRLKLIEKAALKVSKVNRNLLTVSSLARDPISEKERAATAKPRR